LIREKRGSTASYTLLSNASLCRDECDRSDFKPPRSVRLIACHAVSPPD